MTNIEPLIIQETPGAPIACDMTTASDTPEERLAEYGRLFAHALVERERTADAMEFRFAAKAGVAQWVADLARREAACCPFLSYRITYSTDRIVWRTSSQAGPAAQTILDEFGSLPELLADGFDGLIDRLGRKGIPISSPKPGLFVAESHQEKPGLLSRVKNACGC
jgi:hypothetical protein